jgi:hypothetical protein
VAQLVEKVAKCPRYRAIAKLAATCHGGKPAQNGVEGGVFDDASEFNTVPQACHAASEEPGTEVAAAKNTKDATDSAMRHHPG